MASHFYSIRSALKKKERESIWQYCYFPVVQAASMLNTVIKFKFSAFSPYYKRNLLEFMSITIQSHLNQTGCVRSDLCDEKPIWHRCFLKHVQLIFKEI